MVYCRENVDGYIKQLDSKVPHPTKKTRQAHDVHAHLRTPSHGRGAAVSAHNRWTHMERTHVPSPTTGQAHTATHQRRRWGMPTDAAVPIADCARQTTYALHLEWGAGSPAREPLRSLCDCRCQHQCRSPSAKCTAEPRCRRPFKTATRSASHCTVFLNPATVDDCVSSGLRHGPSSPVTPRRTAQSHLPLVLSAPATPALPLLAPATRHVAAACYVEGGAGTVFIMRAPRRIERQSAAVNSSSSSSPRKRQRVRTATHALTHG